MRKRARFLMKSSLKERVVRFFFLFPKVEEREEERERGRERACGQMLQLQFERGDVR